MAQGKSRATSSRRPAEQRSKRATNRIEVGGHEIAVRGAPGVDEELWIDGERRQFFVTSGGYHLLDDAYRPPEKTLIDAARAYIERRANQTL